MRVKNLEDFYAGIMFLAFGVFFAAWGVTHYRLGSLQQMGLGYFPSMLGGGLAILGVIIVVKSLSCKNLAVPQFHLRPLVLVSLACALYGFLLEPLGLIVSTVLLTFVSALAGREFKWKEMMLLSVLLVIFTILIFVKGISLPVPIWPTIFY